MLPSTLNLFQHVTTDLVRSGPITIVKEVASRSPHSTNISVHEYVCLYWICRLKSVTFCNITKRIQIQTNSIFKFLDSFNTFEYKMTSHYFHIKNCESGILSALGVYYV
jgi:hypothetical protein